MEIVVGRGIGILVPLVDPAGGDAVAEHLRHVFFRHLAAAHGHRAVRSDAVVDPVLKVVAVAALVVQPGQAHAGLAALLIVGAAEALVVFGAAPELRGTVLAQVVGQALPIQAQLEAVAPHQPAMAVYGFQMFPNVHPWALLTGKILLSYHSLRQKDRGSRQKNGERSLFTRTISG